ncbi:DNA polymerase Y family protein [Kitasatospora sp. MMS16-BH015]|uniref:DNA polymerase Y family protein n=1 Tax=Kitasatospora sp. MMS16-BH015 TaxID=2018025 RepID=UPI001C2C8F30|nr:DNA polymerase Y family protein [Kitasatospora sp. MMS16-BH015]
MVAVRGDGSAGAVAVTEGGRVLACSAAARAAGVRRGQPLRLAHRLCPELTVRERDEETETRLFEPVVAAVAAFTPRVEVLRPGMCAIPVKGPSRYFGGEEALAARVHQAVAETLAAGQPNPQTPGSAPGTPWAEPESPVADEEDRPHGQIGVADGLFAATLAARAGALVPTGRTAEFLAPYPVAALGDEELAELLVRLGLPTVGAFAALPARAVADRFGPVGTAAHRRARGLSSRPLTPRTEHPDLSVAHHFDPPETLAEPLIFVARTLAEQLHTQLAATGLTCRRVAVEITCADGHTATRLWHHNGSLTAPALAERVRWQLHAWQTTGALARKSPQPAESVAPTVSAASAGTAGFAGTGAGVRRSGPAGVEAPGDGGGTAMAGATAPGARPGPGSPAAPVAGAPFDRVRQPADSSSGDAPADVIQLFGAGSCAPVAGADSSDGHHPPGSASGSAPGSASGSGPDSGLGSASGPDRTASSIGPRLLTLVPAEPTAAAEAVAPHPLASPPDAGPLTLVPAAQPAGTGPAASGSMLSAGGSLTPVPLAPVPSASPVGSSPVGSSYGGAGGFTVLRLVPDGLVVDRGRQLALWGQAVAEDRVERAVARVQAVLGWAGLRRVGVGGGRGPGEGHVRVPWGEPHEEGVVAPWPGRIEGLEPSVVLRRAVPAVVLDAAGQVVTVSGRAEVSAPPDRVEFGGGRVAVVGWTGPWPAVERWWDESRSRRRARFQVTVSDGRALLLTVENGRWSVEAAYD